MKLLLKNNYIYLPTNETVCNGNSVVCKVNVLDIPNLDDYIFTAVINNSEQIVFKDSFEISYKQFKFKYLNLSIIATSKDGNNVIEYKADPYPITKAVLLGQPSNEWYSHTFKGIVENVLELLNSVKVIKNNISKLEDSTMTLNEKMEVVQKDISIVEHAVLELKEEGELI